LILSKIVVSTFLKLVATNIKRTQKANKNFL
jgi:hypothetical protein